LQTSGVRSRAGSRDKYGIGGELIKNRTKVREIQELSNNARHCMLGSFSF